MEYILFHPRELSCVIFGCVAAVWDLRYRQIPNWITFSAILAGPLLNLSIDGWSGMRGVLAGWILAFALLFVGVMKRGMGMGDLKLMMGLCGILGWPDALALAFDSFLFAIVIGLPLSLYRRRLWSVARRTETVARDMVEHPLVPHAALNLDVAPADAFPFGAPIALASCVLALLHRSPTHFGGL